MFGATKKALILVFGLWQYWLLFIIFTLAFFILAIIIPSYQLISFVFNYRGSDILFSGEILALVWDFFQLNSTVFSRLMIGAMAFLSGLNLTMFVYYVKRKIQLYKSAGLGFLAILISIFGIGCASCGSVIITSIFGFGAVVFLGFLPLHGLEISILGVILLLVSIWLVAGKIVNPLACKPPRK